MKEQTFPEGGLLNGTCVTMIGDSTSLFSKLLSTVFAQLLSQVWMVRPKQECSQALNLILLL